MSSPVVAQIAIPASTAVSGSVGTGAAGSRSAGPVSADSGAADFRAAVGVRNAVAEHAYGTTELSFTAEEVLPHWQQHSYRPRTLIGAWDDSSGAPALVAIAEYETQVDDADTAWVSVAVLPSHRRLGFGTALEESIEARATSEKRTKLLAYAFSARAEGAQLVSPTGYGSVPTDNPEVRFLLRRGYRLEQVERGSRLALPVPAAHLAHHHGAARAAAGPGYRLHTWVGQMPERWREDMALLHTRITTDAPSAGLEESEDRWSAERILDEEDRIAASGRAILTAAVEQAPTGRLVGYSDLSVPDDRRRSIEQLDTLVLREHRGHRLGMLLKAANLEQLEREMPGHPSVITFNAEENIPMLAINESLGFVPIGYEGAWRKGL